MLNVNQAYRLWACQGKLQPELARIVDDQNNTDQPRFLEGGVRVTVGAKGTEIKWLAQSPCVASLFSVINWLPQATAPILLRFNASGWFEEFFEKPEDAARRIEDVIARSDRHFPVRTFVEEVEPSRNIVSKLLVDILENPGAAEIYSVECEYNKYNNRFTVEHIGSRSPIARFYGTHPNSYPCTVSSYGDRVSAGYSAVLASGRPRVDHVLAAFRLPDNQVHWVPYHRLILPVTGPHNADRVRVVSQIAPVTFQVI